MLLAVVNDEFTQTDEKQINFNQKRRKLTHHYYMAAIFFGDRISMMFMDIFESIITMIRIYLSYIITNLTSLSHGSK